MKMTYKKRNMFASPVDATISIALVTRPRSIKEVPILSDSQVSFYAGLQKTSVFSFAKKFTDSELKKSVRYRYKSNFLNKYLFL